MFHIILGERGQDLKEAIIRANLRGYGIRRFLSLISLLFEDIFHLTGKLNKLLI